MTELQKGKRSKSLYISIILIIAYLSVVIFYTVSAVGLFDNFMYLYKFSLSYMDYLILPMVLLSFLTSSFSCEYKSDTIKHIWTIPISRRKYFLSKLLYIFLVALALMGIVFVTVCLASYFSRFRESMTFDLIIRFLELCVSSSLFVTMSIIPISIITIVTKGNGAITNLAGSIYIVISFFLMKYLQGFSPLASAPHIIWYKNFEGVQNNSNIVFLLSDVILVFFVYVVVSLKVLEEQDI